MKLESVMVAAAFALGCAAATVGAAIITIVEATTIAAELINTRTQRRKIIAKPLSAPGPHQADRQEKTIAP